MTAHVHKSQIEPDFADRVEAFRLAMIAHQTSEDKPAPQEHALIEACIRRQPVEGGPDTFVADWTLIDDTPPPPTLEQRKAFLHHQVALAEQRASHAVLSPGRRRLHDIQHRDATEADTAMAIQLRHKRMAVQTKDVETRTAHDNTFLAASENIQAMVEVARDPEVAGVHTDRAALLVSDRRIERHGAELQAEIDGLTKETIDAWVLREFPGG